MAARRTNGGRLIADDVVEDDRPGNGRPTFYSIAATARMLGMSQMTLRRAIQDGQFPAVRIRGRVIVPAKAIDAMTDSAIEGSRLIDAASLVPGGES
jgi:excisionase family DNA binding protein